MSGADLFVVCKSCEAEVSAFITECPYCGHRLRKRAPKLDRPGEPPAKPRRTRERRMGRRRSQPRLGRLRPGEMPGIRFDVRPWATIVLVAVGFAVSLVAQFGVLGIVISWPRDPGYLLLSPFLHVNIGYLVLALGTVALFGWLLERRHGRWAPPLVFALGAAAGIAVAGAVPFVVPWLEWASSRAVPEAPSVVFALGAGPAALAMLAAWVVPDLRERRAGNETDSDLLGAGVIAAVVLALPLVVHEVSLPGTAAGGIAGLVLGLVLATFSRER